MALAFLLASPEVRIEAITTATGLTRAAVGAENILRFLALVGREDIPVYVGGERPSSSAVGFPREWQTRAEELPGVTLPGSRTGVMEQPAAKFLRERSQSGDGHFRILALGPLTNLAALCRKPGPLLQDLVIMGGAFDIPGNATQRDVDSPQVQSAEWNMAIDPTAAHAVLSSAVPGLLVPLDAAAHVPITPAFIDEFCGQRTAVLHRFVCELLDLVRPHAAAGRYCAWDPLAAVSLVDPSVLSTRQTAVAVCRDTGTTRRAEDGSVKIVAISADSAAWQSAFCTALEAWERPNSSG